MAEKLPVIIDNRGDNTVVTALRRLCQLSETSCPANTRPKDQNEGWW
jgi:hypothetical protein